MGNRAVITWETDSKYGVELIDRKHDKKYKVGIGVYLHWCGGPDKVNAFLLYCKARKFRDPLQDNYGLAYLVNVITNCIGDGLSVGVDHVSELDTDNWDNGTYILGADWTIKDRLFTSDVTEPDRKILLSLLCGIDKSQPLRLQLGEKKLKQFIRSL